MQTSIETLRSVWTDAEIYNVPEETVFQRLNVAHIREFDMDDIGSGNELYFVVYEDNPGRDGWYIKAFDRTNNMPKLGRRNNIFFVVDDRVPDNLLQGLKYIRVQNVFLAIERLREHVLSTVSPTVIGVTGSVGKTTTAALIQAIISRKFECRRVYSKRLTPLTLSSWIVNCLDQSHRVLSLEYSMYRTHHVLALTRIVRPQIGILLNIKRVHLGVAGINSLSDIKAGKQAIVERSRVAIINADDPIVSSLKRKRDITFSIGNPRVDAFVKKEGSNEVEIRLNVADQSVWFRPYVMTDLFYYQSLASALAASHLGVSPQAISEALDQFKPAENRIGWMTIRGHRVFFDGDVTGAGRVSAISENRYASSVLLIAEFDFGEENVSLQAEYFSEVFGRFDEVRVLDRPKNLEVLSRYRLRNCSLVPQKSFWDGLSRFQFKVLHFGTYFRKHKNLDHLFVLTGA